MSGKAQDLVKRSLEDIDPERLEDFHMHVAGVGSGGTNLFINARMRSWLHPFHRIKFAFYKSACAVRNEDNTDQEFLERLIALIRHFPARGKHRLLAFDKNYNRDGSVNLEKTEFYVPNEYVFEIADRHPDLFLPVISVHPYRKDAIPELEKWAARGGRIVKWLPNAMGIDPSSDLCDSFYSKMKELKLVLLSHGGEEKAVQADEDQKLGSPLLLRRALEQSVRVIVAHCAGLGSNEDIESRGREKRPNFDFFLRLMEEPRYVGLLFGEISAMAQFNRLGAPLTTIMERESYHQRLLNGSDYPLPAINLLVRTGSLVRHGYITTEQRGLLNEIYHFNPLLFDFTLKRCLKSPTTSRRLPSSIFTANPDLLPA